MRDCIRELCVLSLFCGAALSLCPEGGVKRLLRCLGTAALLALLLNALGKLDLSGYPLDAARFHERERELSLMGDELRRELNRHVIEEEYAAYIQDKAAELGLTAEEIRIGVRWSAEGVWIPESSRIRCGTAEERERLRTVLEADLGIPAERQEWIEDG